MIVRRRNGRHTFWKAVFIASIGLLWTAVISLVSWGVSVETRLTGLTAGVGHTQKNLDLFATRLADRLNDLEKRERKQRRE